MKKILLAAMILVSVNSFAQIDSGKIKTSISLQVRDWLYLNSFLATSSDEFENVYDSMKVKLRVAVAPNLTTVIKVDSVRQNQIVRLAQLLKGSEYGVVAIPYTRINTALKSNAYLTQKIDDMDATYTAQYNQRVQGELDKLRKVLQQ